MGTAEHMQLLLALPPEAGRENQPLSLPLSGTLIRWTKENEIWRSRNFKKVSYEIGKQIDGSPEA